MDEDIRTRFLALATLIIRAAAKTVAVPPPPGLYDARAGPLLAKMVMALLLPP